MMTLQHNCVILYDKLWTKLWLFELTAQKANVNVGYGKDVSPQSFRISMFKRKLTTYKGVNNYLFCNHVHTYSRVCEATLNEDIKWIRTVGLREAYNFKMYYQYYKCVKNRDIHYKDRWKTLSYPLSINLYLLPPNLFADRSKRS